MGVEEERGASAQQEGRRSASQDVTADYLHCLTEHAFQMEERRCDSLRGLAGTLLTCSSILSVALLTVAAPLFGYFYELGACPHGLLMVVYLISLLALALSILFAVLSQLRFQYRALPNPKKLKDVIANGYDFSKMDAAEHFVDSVDDIYVSLETRNETMRHLLKASTICVVVSISVMLMGGLILWFVAFCA